MSSKRKDAVANQKSEENCQWHGNEVELLQNNTLENKVAEVPSAASCLQCSGRVELLLSGHK